MNEPLSVFFCGRMNGSPKPVIGFRSSLAEAQREGSFFEKCGGTLLCILEKQSQETWEEFLAKCDELGSPRLL